MMMVSIGVLAASLFGAATPTTIYPSHAARQTPMSQSVARVDRSTRQESLNGRGQVWHSTAPRSVPSATPRAPFAALGR
jgi:hypothetical protein